MGTRRYADRSDVQRSVRDDEEGEFVLKAIADVIRSIGGAIATIVTLPFRAVARLFGGASDTARGHH